MNRYAARKRAWRAHGAASLTGLPWARAWGPPRPRGDGGSPGPQAAGVVWVAAGQPGLGARGGSGKNQSLLLAAGLRDAMLAPRS